MKKITFIGAFLFASVSMVAQAVIIDKIPDENGSALITTQSADDGVGVFCADDFTLTADTILGELDVFGLASDAAGFGPAFVGVNVIIYADAAGVPAGDPTMLGSGVLELFNIDPSNLTLVDDGAQSVDFMAIKFTDANGGVQTTLPAGDYWLHVSAVVTGGPAEAGRWNWFGSADANVGSEPQLIDPDDLFGLGATSWGDISALIGAPFNNFGWQLRDEAPLGVDDNVLAQVSVYPNPTTEVLNLRIPSSIELNGAALYDVLGKNTGIEVVAGQMNTASLASGVYILKVITSAGTLTEKIVKQ